MVWLNCVTYFAWIICWLGLAKSLCETMANLTLWICITRCLEQIFIANIYLTTYVNVLYLHILFVEISKANFLLDRKPLDSLVPCPSINEYLKNSHRQISDINYIQKRACNACLRSKTPLLFRLDTYVLTYVLKLCRDEFD